MKAKSMIVPVGVTTLLAITQVASAHPGHAGTTGFAAGVQHPLTGVDHILAMLAVGLCAAQIGGRALWLLPLTFLLFMAGAGLVAMGGASVAMSTVDQCIAASVLLLGLMLVAGSKVSLPMSVGLVALFAVFHGYAHGAEMQTGAAPAAYSAGFILATALLLSTGLATGVASKYKGLSGLSRMAGGVIALSGLMLFWI